MATGTQTATLGTTHSLTTITTAGAYVLKVNVNTGLGDVLAVEGWTKTLTGSTSKLAFRRYFSDAQMEPNYQTDPLEIDHELIYKIRQDVGTMTITSMTGTVTEGSTVTGGTSGATGVVEWMDNPTTPTEIRMRVTSDGTAFQDAEQAQVDGSNYLTLNDATPAVQYEWTSTEL